MITSVTNRHVGDFRALHQPKGRREAGAFLIEGPHLLAAALDAKVLPRAVLYDPEALARSDDGRALLDRLEDLRAGSTTEVLEATAEVVERAGDTRTSQGVVATVAIEDVTPDKVRARRRGRMRPLLLVLDGLADPGNMGTVLRSALAADVDEVLLAPGSVDPLSPKVVRAAAGTQFHLPVRVGVGWDEVRQQLAGAPATHQVLLAEAGAHRPYDQVDFTQRGALIIGNEAHGPSAPARKLATEHIMIPMYNKVESLNAAVAASVILFEAARQRRGKG